MIIVMILYMSSGRLNRKLYFSEEHLTNLMQQLLTWCSFPQNLESVKGSPALVALFYDELATCVAAGTFAKEKVQAIYQRLGAL